MKINYEEKSHLFEKRSTKVTTFLNLFAGVMLILMIIISMIWCFYHEAKVVSGISMQPTINSNFSEEQNKFDIVIMNKTQKINKQNIAIVDFSEYNKDELIIKRVIATAGDSVKIVWNTEKEKSEVYLKKQGEQEFSFLEENYTKNELPLPGKKTCAETFSIGWADGKYNSYTWNGYEKNGDGSITIQEGFCFLLGDNREVSLDSSEVGPFKISSIIGIVDTIEPEGTFVNRLIRNIFGLTLNN